MVIPFRRLLSIPLLTLLVLLGGGCDEQVKEEKPFKISDDSFLDSLTEYYRFGAFYSLDTNLEMTLILTRRMDSMADYYQDFGTKSSALGLYGLYYDRVGQYEKALIYHNRNLDTLLTRHPDSVGYSLSACYTNLADVYLKLDGREKCISLYRKSLKTDLKLQDSALITQDLLCLGDFYGAMGEIDSALKYLQMCENYMDKKDRNHLLEINAVWGFLKLEIQELDSAAFYIRKSHTYSANLLDTLFYYDRMSQVYEKKNNLELSKQYLDSTIPVQSRNPDAYLLDNYAFQEARLEYARGNYKLAYETAKRAREIEDSLQGIELNKRIAALEARYETQRKENEIKQLTARSEVDQLQIEKHRTEKIYLLILACLIALTLGVILLYYRSTKAKNGQLEKQNLMISQSHQEMKELMRESHHRITNNLQVVSSLLKMQSKNLDNPQAQAALMEAFNRVKTIAAMHHRFQGSSTFKTIDMEEFLTQLTQSIKSSLTAEGSLINIQSNVSGVELPSEQSITIGLIVNEAITNSLKYAFVKNAGQVQVDMSQKAGEVQLEIRDNGRGFPTGFDPFNGQSLGFRIIQSLTVKLKGTLSFENNEGAQIRITFPVQKAA